MRRTYIEGGVANAHWYWVVELGHMCGVTSPRSNSENGFLEINGLNSNIISFNNCPIERDGGCNSFISIFLSNRAMRLDGYDSWHPFLVL